MVNLLKIGKIVLILLVVAVFLNLFLEKKYFVSEIKFGVSFSPNYAEYLNLDWQKTYLHILDNLQVKNLRLPSYWDMLEPQQGKYNFSQTDFMLNEASKRGVKVVLVVGARQPRWPECHIPVWAKSLTVVDRQQRILDFVQKTVERYKNYPEIWAWQVENEPFAFWFGENCDTTDSKLLKEEIRVLKRLDSRPVIVTDSGEWSNWIIPMQSADILGVSLYRKAHNQMLSSYISYPFSAWMYPLKSDLVRKLFAPKNEKTIISELQAEPWVQKGILDTPFKQQVELFTLKDFQDNIEFAKKTGFDSIYLWGVEWWYLMAQQGRLEYLEYAKTLFR